MNWHGSQVCFFYCVTVVIVAVVEDAFGGDTAALQLSLTSICVRRGLYSPSSHVCSGVREPTNYPDPSHAHPQLIPAISGHLSPPSPP